MKRLFSWVLTLVLLVGLIMPVGAATDQVEKLVGEMSLRDKITQMLMVDFRYWDEDPFDNQEAVGLTVMNDQVYQIISDYNFGAVIYFAQNLVDTEQAYTLTMNMQRAATIDGGIAMLICADQEGGSVYRLGNGTALPGNMALGATGDVRYATMAGQIMGSELSALGINTNLSPVVDVNNNANNPVIGLRSYSDDPALVGQMAAAVIDGMAEYNVIGCAKHFPGHGDTDTDSHYGLPVVDKSLEVLQQCELAPYDLVIGQGVDMIMTAHILYPQLERDTILSGKTGREESLPATMSDDIVTGLLKEQMGFGGVVVTDAMNMAGIVDYWSPVQSIVLAIQAGVDMICMPCTLRDKTDLDDLDAIISGVMSAVEDGTIPMERINDSVSRILSVKENRGILDWSAEGRFIEQAVAIVGGTENRQMEREIAAAAVTVVQNKDNTLPLVLTEQSRVLMMVPYENEKAQMIMGWNRAAQAGLIPEGAQLNVVRFGEGTTLDTYRGEIDWADVIILNSEVSRASKMNGRSWETAYPLRVIEYAQVLGKVTIVQSVDKPYDVQCYPDADAVLAVYGSKGSSVDPTEALVGGVTGSAAAYGPNLIAGVEVILGVFEAKGTLSVDIPKLVNGAYTDEVIFERGFGITYDSLLVEKEPEKEPEEVPMPEPSPEPTAQPPEPAEEAPVVSPLPSVQVPEEVLEEPSAVGNKWLVVAVAVLVLCVIVIVFLGMRRRKIR